MRNVTMNFDLHEMIENCASEAPLMHSRFFPLIVSIRKLLEWNKTNTN
jgi:hypothetical protein